MGSKQTRSGQRRLLLLSKIGHLGSLSAAAKACGMSYKGAWQAVEAMNLAAETELVIAQKGGVGGGGMSLTPAGEELVRAFQLFNEQMQHWMRELEHLSPGVLSQLEIMRKVSMRTSARNLFNGCVKSISKGIVNSEVVLSIGDHTEVVAQITPDSVERLGLEVGCDAYALVKASWVILIEAPDAKTHKTLKTSARNQFCGVVCAIEQGAVNSDVTIEIPSGQKVSAIITGSSLHAMGLEIGTPCCALFKASHVLLAVSD